MKVSVFKFFVCLAGVVQGSTLTYGNKAPCAERVQCAAVEAFANIKSLDSFAANQYASHSPVFIKQGENFGWLDGSLQEKPKNSLMCEETVSFTREWGDVVSRVRLISEEESPLEIDDCFSLKKEIIHAHARVAVQGKLSKENPYSEHLAWRCEGENCQPIGDLAQINDSRKNERDILNKLPMKVCSVVDIRKTKHSKDLYKIVSATVFGTVSKAGDICRRVLAHYL